MRKITFGLCLVAMLVAFTLAPSALLAFGPDWDAFTEATLTGVTVTAAPDGLSYVLSLSAAPTITVGTETYDVKWCQGFFLLDPTGAESMTATGADNGDWSWCTEPGSPPHSVVGWEGGSPTVPLDPSGRMELATSRTFTLSALSAPEGKRYGFHFGYEVEGKTMIFEVTNHFKGEPVPEPGSLVVAITTLAGMGAFIRRRRQTT